MEYRRLGKSGLKVSAISLGAWLTYGSSVDFDTASRCIRVAIEHGINFIDVADSYAMGKAEEVVGRIIKDFKRSDLVISTKAFWPMSDNVNDRGLSRKHLFESVHKSLKRFDTDYVDLFFCHRFDPETPLEETICAIDDLIRQGKILYWGTSLWPPAAIDEAVGIARAIHAHPPITEQPLYNMLDRDAVEGDLETVVTRHGIGLVVWSPLAQGVLTGKYNKDIPADSRATSVDPGWFAKQIAQDRLHKAQALTAFAEKMGITLAALALAWALKHPNVSSVITGASKPSQVTENLKALEITITDAMEDKIEAILQNRPAGSHR